MSLLKSAHGGNTREAAELLGVSPEQLLDFTVAGYGYCPELSTENKLVFRILKLTYFQKISLILLKNFEKNIKVWGWSEMA